MPGMEGKVGRQTLDAGVSGPIRQAKTGDLVIEQGGKYAEATLAGRMFSVANQAKIATTAALATAWTGLAICNPTGSGIQAKISKFGYGLQIASDTAGAIGLMIAATATLTTNLLVPVNRLTGGTAAKVLASAGHTIATPVLWDLVGSYGTVATTSTSVTFTTHEIDGALILQPGYTLCTYTTLATTACFVFSFLWEEV